MSDLSKTLGHKNYTTHTRITNRKQHDIKQNPFDKLVKMGRKTRKMRNEIIYLFCI